MTLDNLLGILFATFVPILILLSPVFLGIALNFIMEEYYGRKHATEAYLKSNQPNRRKAL